MNKFIVFISVLTIIFFSACTKHIDQPKKFEIIKRCMRFTFIGYTPLQPLTRPEIDSILEVLKHPKIDPVTHKLIKMKTPTCEHYQTDTIYY